MWSGHRVWLINWLIIITIYLLRTYCMTGLELGQLWKSFTWKQCSSYYLRSEIKNLIKKGLLALFQGTLPFCISRSDSQGYTSKLCLIKNAWDIHLLQFDNGLFSCVTQSLIINYQIERDEYQTEHTMDSWLRKLLQTRLCLGVGSVPTSILGLE